MHSEHQTPTTFTANIPPSTEHLDPAAGFLIFLWILFDIKSSSGEQAAAAAAGIQIDTRQVRRTYANGMPRHQSHVIGHTVCRYSLGHSPHPVPVLATPFTAQCTGACHVIHHMCTKSLVS